MRIVSLFGRVAGAAALQAVPIGLGLVLCLTPNGLVERLRDLAFDDYQWASPRTWTPDLPVRVVDIDDASLARLGQWPWPRDRLADMVTRLAGLGASAVGFDIVFSEADRSSPEEILKGLPDLPASVRTEIESRGASHDATFASALAEVPTTLALALNGDPTQSPSPLKTGFANAGADPRGFVPRFAGAVFPIPRLAQAASGLGSVNFLPDRDLILRTVPLILSVGDGQLVPSLDLELLRIAQGASTVVTRASDASGDTAFGTRGALTRIKVGAADIATERDGQVRVRYAGFEPGRHVSAWKVLAGDIPRDEIEGRIILVGATAAALSDLRSTPIEGGVPGIDIQAEVLEHILSGARLARPDWAPGAEALALVVLGLAAGLAARKVRPLPAAAITLGLVAATVSGSVTAFLHADLLLDAIVPSLTALACYAVVTVALYRRTIREKQWVRSAFSRYVDPAYVELLAADPSRLRLGGEARTVTVMFSDVRDFTPRAEALDAHGIVHFLNILLTRLTAAVQAEKGTIDKYIGDAIMAFWNAPLDTVDHAGAACRAALAMLAEIPGIDTQTRAEAAAAGCVHIPVRIGIGINSGEAIVGNMGSDQVFNYSMVGDAVNVAARLESACKEFGVTCIVSASTAGQASGFVFVDLGAIELKGKSSRTEVYALHGRAVDSTLAFETFLTAHDAAMDALRAGSPDAGTLIRTAAAFPEAATYAKLYDILTVEADLARGTRV